MIYVWTIREPHFCPSLLTQVCENDLTKHVFIGRSKEVFHTQPKLFCLLLQHRNSLYFNLARTKLIWIWWVSGKKTACEPYLKNKYISLVWSQTYDWKGPLTLIPIGNDQSIILVWFVLWCFLGFFFVNLSYNDLWLNTQTYSWSRTKSEAVNCPRSSLTSCSVFLAYNFPIC